MDAGIREILEFLSDVPIGTNKDISPLLNRQFPIENFTTDRAAVMGFLNSLENYTTYSRRYNPYRRNLNIGFLPLTIALKNDGLIALKEEQDRIKQGEVNQSTLNVYQSTIDTNKSVQDINLVMIKNFEEQAKINKGLIDNSVRQTDILSGQADILKKQTWIFFATAVFALVAAIIAGISLGVEIRKNQSEKLLQQQTKEIEELRIRIEKLKTDSSAVPMAKKNLLPSLHEYPGR